MEYKTREKPWLAARAGCKLNFTFNSIQYEEVLNFNRSLGIYCFYIGKSIIDSEKCLIADLQDEYFNSKEVQGVIWEY